MFADWHRLLPDEDYRHRLDELCTIPGIASRLARALATMPADIAAYKGFSASRPQLVQRLARLP